MKHWKKSKEKIVYKGYRNILQKTFELPNGNIEDYDIVHENSWSTIAALTTEGKAIIVKQYRPGPEKALYSFPSGFIDGNEAPLVAAKRELLEETGYEADDIFFVKKQLSGYFTAQQYLYIATGCQLKKAQSLDDNEFVSVELWTLSKLKEVIMDKKSDDFEALGLGMIALEYWKK